MARRPAADGPVAAGPPGPAGRRRPRRDAELNRERVLDAAVSTMLRQGCHVPLAVIAAEAGVGVGTLYRSYPDREALLHALEYRAYGLLNQILDEVDRRDVSGLDAVTEFLARTVAVGDQLILPLHGAPPLVSDRAVRARQEINRRLERFIERGHADGSIRAAVNATDIIVFSALITQPLPHGPGWPLTARRQLAIFVNGLAEGGPAELPGPAVTREDIETAFTLRAGSPSPGPVPLSDDLGPVPPDDDPGPVPPDDDPGAVPPDDDPAGPSPRTTIRARSPRGPVPPDDDPAGPVPGGGKTSGRGTPSRRR
jgi:AcrR family transcriptional regulator